MHFHTENFTSWLGTRMSRTFHHALSTLSSCITDVKHWMSNNMLQLNENKTEFIVCATKGFQHYLSDITLKVGNTSIEPSTTVKNLGVNLDSTMLMSDQVTSICQSANFHLRNLTRIRMYIDQNTSHAAVRALITSRLDYANSLLFGISQTSSTTSSSSSSSSSSFYHFRFIQNCIVARRLNYSNIYI